MPLQVRLKAFSRTLTRIVIVFTAAILAAGLVMGRGFLDMLRTSIILAIAAVPEGLLIAVTAICTDKTGTLTEGRMRVTRVDLVDEEHALQTMVLCNNLEGPVDVALWEYARTRLAGDPKDLADGSERLDEQMFTSETKFMITGQRLAGHDHHFLKGAPEIVLGMCGVTADERTRILAWVDEWAGEGLRLLGLAWRDHGALEDHAGYSRAGLIAMEDPIREGVHEAILLAQHAGIQVKMITGDYRRTAERIASTIGLLRPGEEVLEGDKLARLGEDALRERVRAQAGQHRCRRRQRHRRREGDGRPDPARQQLPHRRGARALELLRRGGDDLHRRDPALAGAACGRPDPLDSPDLRRPGDIVLGFEPKENGIRDERPKSLREPILSRLGLSLVWAALGGLSLVALPFVVPALRTALGIVPLNLMQWLLIAGVGLMLLLAVEIGKAITNRRHARRASAP